MSDTPLESSTSATDHSMRSEKAVCHDNATDSPLLRLPGELQNKIFEYIDYSDCIIQVLSLSKTEYNALDANGAPLLHNPYPKDQLWYRIEQTTEEEFSLDNPNIDTRRKRCSSVLGLFPLPYVCRQIRAEFKMLHYSGPSFAFSDRHFNYTKAFPAFIKSLDEHERAAIRSICWPFWQAKEFHHRSQMGEHMVDGPEQACSNDLRKLPNLACIFLQYSPANVGGLMLCGRDQEELERLMAGRPDGVRYEVERAFRRELAVRGMRWQVSHRDDISIECKRKRVYF